VLKRKQALSTQAPLKRVLGAPALKSCQQKFAICMVMEGAAPGVTQNSVLQVTTLSK